MDDHGYTTDKLRIFFHQTKIYPPCPIVVFPMCTCFPGLRLDHIWIRSTHVHEAMTHLQAGPQRDRPQAFACNAVATATHALDRCLGTELSMAMGVPKMDGKSHLEMDDLNGLFPCIETSK